MKKYYQGFFKPKNSEKYIGDINNIIYRSYYELKFLRWCDSNPNILQYASEEIIIPYFDISTGKVKRYFPDFYVIMKEKNNEIKKYIIEIKPYRQTQPPKKGKKSSKNYLYEAKQYERNQCKWEAAKEFCRKNNLSFKLITEKELNIKY